MQCSPDRHRNTKLPTPSALPSLRPPTSLYYPYPAHGIVVFLSPSIGRLCYLRIILILETRACVVYSLPPCIHLCTTKLIAARVRVYILNLENATSISIRIWNHITLLRKICRKKFKTRNMFLFQIEQILYILLLYYERYCALKYKRAKFRIRFCNKFRYLPY